MAKETEHRGSAAPAQGRIFTMEPGQPPPETPRRREAVRRAGSEAMWRFLRIFLGGAGAIVLLKWALGSGALAAVAAVVIIVFYAYDVSRQPAVGKGTDVIDSVYYLGFLYTLVSLCISLMSAGTGNTGSIVGDFGIAITSTMAGMLGRICLTIRRDGSAEGMDDEVRASLNEAGEQLQVQIRYAVADFEQFREDLRERYREHFESIGTFAAGMEQAAKAAQERAEQISKVAASGFNLRAEVEQTVRVFVAELKRTSASVEDGAALIEQTGQRLKVFVDAAQSAGDRWKQEAGQLEALTFSATKVMEAAIERIRKVDLAAELQRQFEASGVWKAAGNRNREEADELRRVARAMSDALEDIRKSNRVLAEQSKREQDRLAAVSGPRSPAGPIPPAPPDNDSDPWSYYGRLAFRATLIAATVALIVYLTGGSRGWWNRSAEEGAATGRGVGLGLAQPEPPAPRSPGSVPDWYQQRFLPQPREP